MTFVQNVLLFVFGGEYCRIQAYSKIWLNVDLYYGFSGLGIFKIKYMAELK